MRVFNVPLSVPFLRCVIAALVDGRLVAGFEARKNPENLAKATLYLPTRRAGRMAREIFLDELNTDAAVLPRIVALGDIDEDELAFAQAATPGAAALDIEPAMDGLQRRLLLTPLIDLWAKKIRPIDPNQAPLVTAGPDMSNGRANSPTEASPCARRARIARRVGSARAAKVADRGSTGWGVISNQ